MAITESDEADVAIGVHVREAGPQGGRGPGAAAVGGAEFGQPVADALSTHQPAATGWRGGLAPPSIHRASRRTWYRCHIHLALLTE